MMMLCGSEYSAKKTQSSRGSNTTVVDRVEWNARPGWTECEITVKVILLTWLVDMDHHKCVQFPLLPSQQPLGIFDGIQAQDGPVDNPVLTDRPHLPAIFGAGGPMYVRSSSKRCLSDCYLGSSSSTNPLHPAAKALRPPPPRAPWSASETKVCVHGPSRVTLPTSIPSREAGLF